MASKTEIVNRALTLIGAAPITNLTENTNNARIVNRVYDTSLRAILSECEWNFAKKRVLLTETTTSLAWTTSDETTVYTKPSDVIRIFGINAVNVNGVVWRVEGDYIVSNMSGLGIRYVQYLDNPDKYPASFTTAFADLLAADFAYMILNSPSVAETMLTKYASVSLPKAMSENSQEGTQQGISDDSWVNAKYSNIN